MNSLVFFWIVAAVLLVFGGAAVILALTGRSPFKAGGEARTALLAQNLADLDRDAAAGLLSEKAREAAADDVRRAALEASVAPARRADRHPVRTALFVTAAGVAAALALYAHFGAPGLIEVFSAEPEGGLMKADGTLADNTREASPEAFRLYLKRRPEDERAWVLYARQCADRGDWQGSHDAYASAVALGRFAAQDADVLMQMAAVTFNLRTEAASDEAIRLLQRAEALDEKNTRVKELLAMTALQSGRWRVARETLEALLLMMPADEPARQSVSEAALYAAEAERREQAK